MSLIVHTRLPQTLMFNDFASKGPRTPHILHNQYKTSRKLLLPLREHSPLIKCLFAYKGNSPIKDGFIVPLNVLIAIQMMGAQMGETQFSFLRSLRKFLQNLYFMLVPVICFQWYINNWAIQYQLHKYYIGSRTKMATQSHDKPKLSFEI